MPLKLPQNLTYIWILRFNRISVTPPAWNNDNDMRIVDVVYDEYALVHTIKTKNGVSEVLNKLYSEFVLPK